MDDRSVILTFHSLDDSGSVISFSPARFAEQMEGLAASGARVASLAQVCDTPGSFALTFDDGYENFAGQAWPILKRYGFPATLFVVSEYAGRTNRWTGQLPSVPELPLLDESAIRTLAAEGVEIGAHTHTHPDLTGLTEQRVREEIETCARWIEEIAGTVPASFAYPYGRSTAPVREIAASRFVRCCGTRMDYCRAGADSDDLPRVDSFYLRGSVGAGDLFTPAGRRMIAFRGAARALRQRIRG